MTVRFFMLQAHYRSTLDFSNEALQAAEKGYSRLMNAMKLMDSLKTSANSSVTIDGVKSEIYAALNDDFNTPIAIASIFEMVRMINSINDGKETINLTVFENQLKTSDETFEYYLSFSDLKSCYTKKILNTNSYSFYENSGIFKFFVKIIYIFL
jgi:cysteinyl-tRNA synthetase